MHLFQHIDHKGMVNSSDFIEYWDARSKCHVKKQGTNNGMNTWARYVLLRPGMSYTELKRATLQRNQLDPTSRIPGTYRTVVIAHLLCFAAALPAVITSPAVFPKVLVAATASRVAAGI